MSRPVLGIDLGTTNCALAHDGVVEPLAQLTNPGEVRAETLLPSFLFLPGAADFPAGSLGLPWNAENAVVVGALAAKRGVENAGRLVASAKSWLSHPAVDRMAAILPAAARRAWSGCRRWRRRARTCRT